MSSGEQHEAIDAHGWRSWPRWVWLVIVGLAMLQPLAVGLCKYAPPEGMVSTGLHIPDSALFIQSMYMFDTNFYSPYATVFAEHGSHHYSYFSIPHLWFYGLQGLAAGSLGIDYFLFYGVVNGICAGLFLASVYAFMREAAQGVANLAFVLFALGGSVGGVLFIVTGVMGIHSAPAFEDIFWRFAVFELLEGAHLFPVTYYPRSYYTFSLACCFFAFLLLMRGQRYVASRTSVLLFVVMLLGTFVNARFGVFTAGAAVLYLVDRRLRGESVQFLPAALFFTAVVAGQMSSFLLMSTNPVMIENHIEVGNFAAYFSPLLSAGLLILPLFLWQCLTRLRGMAWPWRWLTGAGLGYLAAFAILFIVYQAYYGNLLVARDAAVATAISDRALVGAVIGLALVGRKRKREIEVEVRWAPHPPVWIIIWGLGFLALSISAFGQGWFLRFGPQRLMVLMYVPVCIVAAQGLHMLWARRPGVARTWAGAVAACGVITILVSTFHFQAPVGRTVGAQPYDEQMSYLMTEADSDAVSKAGNGTVAAVPPLSDVVALNMTKRAAMKGSLLQDTEIEWVRGTQDARVLFGIGTFNMADQPYLDVKAVQDCFLDPDCEQRQLIQQATHIETFLESETWSGEDEAFIPPLHIDYEEEGLVYRFPVRRDRGLLISGKIESMADLLSAPPGWW